MEFTELIKNPRADDIQENNEETFRSLTLLHSNIDSIDKRVACSSGTIVIKCEDLHIIQLDIPGTEECLNIVNSTEALSSPGSVTLTCQWADSHQGAPDCSLGCSGY
uniref:Uncharacterized protein n=1 Tax=Corvus moneduloides TaxID=1196302 RepID=A0A8C3DXS1_CORMO